VNSRDYRRLQKEFAELEDALTEARREAEYYRKTAQATGARHLQDVDRLWRLITESKHTQQELKSHKHLLAATLEATTDGILAIDGRQRVTHANGRFAELWTISPELMDQGDAQGIFQFCAAQLVDPGAFLQSVAESAANGAENLDTIRFKNGRVFQWYSRPLVCNKRVAGQVWCFRDVTERTESLERTPGAAKALAKNVEPS
jgi:PAS domain-containing protein